MTPTKGIVKTSHSKNNAAKKSLFFQPKLSINSPNDSDSHQDERETDVMAEKIIRTPAYGNTFFHPAINSIQRKCTHCEEEGKLIQKKEGVTSTVDGISFLNDSAIQRQEKDTDDPKLQITKKIELPAPQDKLPSIIQSPENKDADKDKPHLGIDFSKGISANPPLFPSPETYAFTLVYRNFDLKSFGEDDDPFSVDVGLHEPNFQLLLSPDPHNRAIYQAAFTLINLHFRRHKKEFIEVGLSPLGTYSDPSGTLGGGAQVQVELHITSRFSLTASSAITGSKHDDKAPIDYSSISLGSTGGYDWSWNPVSVGMVWHFDPGKK